MTARTCSRVCAATPGALLMTRETAALDTPAAAATSLTVGLLPDTSRSLMPGPHIPGGIFRPAATGQRSTAAAASRVARKARATGDAAPATRWAVKIVRCGVPGRVSRRHDVERPAHTRS